MAMVEYTIRVNSFNLETSTINISLLPQNNNYVTEKRMNLRVEPDRLSEILALENVSDMLVELRKEVIKMNDYLQNVWADEMKNRLITIPEQLMSFVGQEFPVVTKEEINEYKAEIEKASGVTQEEKLIYEESTEKFKEILMEYLKNLEAETSNNDINISANTNI